jgi:hypothetical protein
MKPQKYTVHAEFGYDCYLLADQKGLNATRIYLQYGQEVVLASDFEHLEHYAEAMSADCERLEKRVRELEEKVKSMRNCLNCKHVSSDYSGYQCANQHDYECEVEGKYDQFWEAK